MEKGVVVVDRVLDGYMSYPRFLQVPQRLGAKLLQLRLRGTESRQHAGESIEQHAITFTDFKFLILIDSQRLQALLCQLRRYEVGMRIAQITAGQRTCIG